MEKIVIAFDIDGTLRCNHHETCRQRNGRMVELLKILSKMKNTRIIAWSGGGKEYTESMIQTLRLEKWITPARCFGKIGFEGKVDIAFDDQQAFALADKNIIVREK